MWSSARWVISLAGMVELYILSNTRGYSYLLNHQKLRSSSTKAKKLFDTFKSQVLLAKEIYPKDCQCAPK